jgi:hypothetical protein
VPVQFDEREEETEQRQTGLRRPGENLTNCHREVKATAPLLDSTHLPGYECNRLRGIGRICPPCLALTRLLYSG